MRTVVGYVTIFERKREEEDVSVLRGTHFFCSWEKFGRVLNKSEQLFWGFIYNYNVILAY